jgi:hypothetical protein
MTTLIIVLVIILVIIYIGQNAFFSSSEKFTDSSSSEPLKLYVFVSGHCPHCITYLKKHHEQVANMCKSKGVQLKKIESDGSPESSKLFSQCDVQFVPTAILMKGDKVYKNLGSVVTPDALSKEL